MYSKSIHMYAINIHMELLAQILSSQVRAELFKLLFNGEKPAIYLRELQRKAKLSIGTIQREINHLKKLDLVIPERDGNRLYYTANASHPLYFDICSMVSKTAGVEPELKKILQKLPQIECAFIFGSFARNQEKSHSDIDLVVIGEISLRALAPQFKDLVDRMGREINPHLYSPQTWKEKLKKKDHFIHSLLKEKKIFLIADDTHLESLS